jgi:carboxyl-terminal processing protease
MEPSPNRKPLVIILSVFVGLLLLTGACSAGFIAGVLTPIPNTLELPLFASREADTPPSADPTEISAATPAKLEELFAPFWQTWDLIHEQYVDQPVDDEALMRGAIKGMLEALGDEHTSYLEPAEFEALNTQLQGEDSYEGIGAWVDTTADYLTVISPMPGSPAEKAGLRTGDKIIAIDGEDMSGIDGEVVRQKVIGPAGSTVKLTILRQGEAPFDVDVTRANITVPIVDYRMLDGDIAYVRLFIFADNSRDELRKALREIMSQRPKGLIFDLRNNGGGYLEAAVDVASEFVGRGVILYEEYGDGTRRTFEARRGGLALDVPLIVLINPGSASASEIVAGAIQDTRRGQLVGEVSFGKGSVQIPTTLKNKAGAVRITVARWLTPNERTIHDVGLTPDVEVPITENDITSDLDPQLQKAIELLSK